MAYLVRPKATSPKGEHPTRAMFVELAVAELEDHLPEEVTIGPILAASGLTKGAFYHHFTDLADLVEAALVVRFTRYVDESIAALTAVAESVNSREEVLAAMAAITAQTQDPGRKSIRFARAHVLSLASRNQRLADALAAEQLRMTEALADLISTAQERGWFNKDVDPKAGAVLIQAYTLGRIVDDITTQPVDPAAWEQLIGRIIHLVF